MDLHGLTWAHYVNLGDSIENGETMVDVSPLIHDAQRLDRARLLARTLFRSLSANLTRAFPARAPRAGRKRTRNLRIKIPTPTARSSADSLIRVHDLNERNEGNFAREPAMGRICLLIMAREIVWGNDDILLRIDTKADGKMLKPMRNTRRSPIQGKRPLEWRLEESLTEHAVHRKIDARTGLSGQKGSRRQVYGYRRPTGAIHEGTGIPGDDQALTESVWRPRNAGHYTCVPQRP
ncbi:hypothetical protein WN48_06110 [Eufriesea mexicana]|nr:hypothetical protein WN48_06110 [Eufriesea mexicana]